MGGGAARLLLQPEGLIIYFCIAIAEGVLFNGLFIWVFVCEASERTQIKPIYLHSALLRALDFLNLRGPVWKAEEEVGWLDGERAGRAKSG